MIIETKKEFKNLADYILRDYLGNEYESYKLLDVKVFANKYLKLEISFLDFKPEDNIEEMRIENLIILDCNLKNDKDWGRLDILYELQRIEYSCPYMKSRKFPKEWYGVGALDYI